MTGGRSAAGLLCRNLEFKNSLKHYISQTVSWDSESFLKYNIFLPYHLAPALVMSWARGSRFLLGWSDREENFQLSVCSVLIDGLMNSVKLWTNNKHPHFPISMQNDGKWHYATVTHEMSGHIGSLRRCPISTPNPCNSSLFPQKRGVGFTLWNGIGPISV